VVILKHMRRRHFIGFLGGAMAALSNVARAQQPLPVIGYVGGQTPDLWAGRLRAFRQGLSEIGYAEGQNVIIEYVWAEGQYDRFPALVGELIRRQVTVIAAPASTAAVLAAKSLTTTIPIVFVTAADPVGAGLVASLARPGGNVTGVAALSNELEPKQLELLHELVPNASSMALLVNPESSVLANVQSSELSEITKKLGLQLHILQASTERDFDEVFINIAKLHIDGLVIGGENLFTTGSKQLAALALHHNVPAIYQFRQFAEAGGLLSYGANLLDTHRLAGIYTGRILKGEKPADLPIQQPTKFELVINRKTAKALGLTVPQSLLVAADEVIE
jgi:putative tryptophan/tyrosine transport system substrate-binding protein